MKKNSKKKALKRAGFTLVELIVVIAILGILTAVAVPTYTGYIKRANDAKVLSELSTILTAAQSCAVEAGTNVKKISVSNDGTVSVECTDTGKSVQGSALSTYASNVGTDGKIANWTQVISGSSYADEGKGGAEWNAATGGENATDAAWKAVAGTASSGG